MAHIDGDLGLVTNGKAAVHHTEGDKVLFYRELKFVAQNHNYKPGWVAYKFKERFGVFPPWSYRDLSPTIPSNATLSWVRSRNIAYAKASSTA